ncbi:hypothetical protein PBI_DEWDROP_111 [Microbacterium phage Dewdrop]|nr:hypothetical protein PBI_LEAF_111 [Microbacterium phage Leaf]QGZ17479.1 hypothetical protein PBI_DEWDROP_111 [Microbacterium phage Dewdrop]
MARCEFKAVRHRGVEGERPCRNHAQRNRRYCHRHQLEERLEEERRAEQ